MQYEEYLTKRRPYQEAGMLLLLERKHACLFFVPGKGKTYPCIDAIRDIDKSKNGRANVLVLSTADAIRNMWEVDIVPQSADALDNATTCAEFLSTYVTTLALDNT